MKNTLIILILVLLIGCNSSKTKKVNNTLIFNDSLETLVEVKDIDTLSFNDQKFDNNTNSYILNSLDSIHIKKWTDKFMPSGLVDLKLYLAYYYSIQDINNNYRLISIFTIADDWNRMYLLTIDKKENLIDQFEVGEEISYLINQTDEMETYASLTSFAVRLDKSHYKIEKRTETTFDYFNENQKDSVIVELNETYLRINDIGKFIKE